MINIHYIIVSKDKSFQLGSESDILSLLTSSRKITCISDNTEPLGIVYNRFMNQERQTKICDFLVFMHADVKLNFDLVEEHLDRCQTKYDVIGLCGTSIMNVSLSPLNWWTGSNPTPEAKWGCVTHGELGNLTSFFSRHSPDVTDHEVACIDGLFIAFNHKALDSGISFDERFHFGLYDTDISFQCVMKYNLKLGVIVEPSLQHYSVGRSILLEQFLVDEIILRDKWNLGFPENSKISLLKNSLNV